MNIRTRKFIISWNNYPKELTLEDLKEKIIKYAETKYLILAFEKGEKEQTPHIQGYVRFKNPQYFNSFRKLLENNDGTFGYIEKAKGNDIENYNYCSKQNNFIEYGEMEEESSNEEEYNLIEDIINGVHFIDLVRKYSHKIYNHYRDFKALYDDIKKEIKNYNEIEELKKKGKELFGTDTLTHK